MKVERAQEARKADEVEIQKGYAPVNGLELYYEIHGSAAPSVPPLILLHGGGDTIQTSFGHVLPGLARDRQVIAFEQQGYGHTADIADRPFTFEQSADDTAALLEHLQVPRADVLGFSAGGTIALQVALRHPNGCASWCSSRPSSAAMAALPSSGRWSIR